MSQNLDAFRLKKRFLFNQQILARLLFQIFCAIVVLFVKEIIVVNALKIVKNVLHNSETI
jgi:hypothetical protein